MNREMDAVDIARDSRIERGILTQRRRGAERDAEEEKIFPKMSNFQGLQCKGPEEV